MAQRGPYRWPRQPRLKSAIFMDGRTVVEIAEAAGLTSTTVSAVTTGRLRLTDTVLAKLAAVLGRDPADLVDDIEVSA